MLDSSSTTKRWVKSCSELRKADPCYLFSPSRHTLRFWRAIIPATHDRGIDLLFPRIFSQHYPVIAEVVRISNFPASAWTQKHEDGLSMGQQER